MRTWMWGKTQFSPRHWLEEVALEQDLEGQVGLGLVEVESSVS